MRALYLEVPDAILEDRRRRGADRHDEVWDGVVHMVPQPSPAHNSFQLGLRDALLPIARRHGLQVFTEAALYDPVTGEANYRVPDLSFARADQISRRGLEGAELVIEVLSPNDESWEKLPMFARAAVREVWIVHPETRALDVLILADASYSPVPPRDGAIRSIVLDVDLELTAGPRLRIRAGATVVEL